MTDREGFNEDDPRYKEYYDIMTDVLKKILYEQEQEINKKRTEEIKEKIINAIKNVRDAFNEFNKKMPKVSAEEKTRIKVDPEGEIDIFVGKPKSKRENKGTNPIGITDNFLKQKLKGCVGFGNIKLGNRGYKITMEPRGIDDREVNIDDEIMVININTQHPAYEQAVIENCMEITAFRAIAISWSFKESVENSLSTEEMYEKIDGMIRFHAEWTKKNKKGGKNSFIEIDDD